MTVENQPLLDFDAISFSNINLHACDVLDDSVLGVAFHSKGASGVHRSGEMVDLGPLGSMLARVAFPISGTELLLFHKSGICKASIENGTSFRLSGVQWGRVMAVARCPRSPDHLIAFHEDGVYTVDISSGSHRTLTEGWTVGWGAARARVHDPSTPDVLYLFHDLALYRVRLADGKHERVGSNTWSGARAAIYHHMGAVVFHIDGTFRVQLGDGACELIAEGCPGARGVLSSGLDTALLLHTRGAHEVNLATGQFFQVCDSTHWADLVCVTPLAPDVVVAGAVCRYW